MDNYRKGVFFNVAMLVSLLFIVFLVFASYNKLTTTVGNINPSLGPSGVMHYSFIERLHGTLPIFLVLVCLLVAFISCIVQSYSPNKKATRLVGVGAIAMLYLLITLLTDYARFSWYNSPINFVPVLLFLFLLFFYYKSFIDTFSWQNKTRVLVSSLILTIIFLFIYYLFAKNHYCHLYNVCNYLDNVVYMGHIGGSVPQGFFPLFY